VCLRTRVLTLNFRRKKFVFEILNQFLHNSQRHIPEQSSLFLNLSSLNYCLHVEESLGNVIIDSVDGKVEV